MNSDLHMQPDPSPNLAKSVIAPRRMIYDGPFGGIELKVYNADSPLTLAEIQRLNDVGQLIRLIHQKVQ